MHTKNKVDSIVIPGLFANPEYFRFQSYKNIFKLFGLSTSFVPGPINILEQGETNFFGKWIDLVETEILENPSLYVISSSVGGSVLLIALLRASKKVELSGKYALVGLDPNVSFRMQNMPKEQIKVWVESLKIPQETVNAALIFDSKLQEELELAIKTFSENENFYFIHGDSDRTIPINEVQSLGIKNLTVVKGLGHNSADKLEENIIIIYEKLFGLKLVPFYNNNSLLRFDYSKEEVVGFFPIDMNERVRWAFILDSSDLKIIPKFYKENRVSFSTEVEINGRLAIGKIADKFVSIDVENIVSEREFYYIQFPMLSYFPLNFWAANLKSILDHINKSQKVVRDDSIKNENDTSLQTYCNEIKDLPLGSIAELEFFDNENKLYVHCFNVYNVLLKSEVSEELALEISILHDIGKGLWIKLAQLKELNNLYKIGQTEVEDMALRRRLGGYIQYVGNKVEIEILNDRFSEYTDYVFSKVNLMDEDISKGIIKKNIGLITPYALDIIQDFMSEKFNQISKLLVLSDLVSDFLPNSPSEYERALVNKEFSLRKRYPTFNSKDFDIAREYIN